MSKIFKNMIPYWRWIILIVVFLFAQAYCDLALPEYTSDIIDVGIQNHGIEHILPEEITEEDYQTAQTFMLSDEKEQFTECYSDKADASENDSSVSTYKLTADEDTLDEMDEDLLVPVVMAYQVFQSGEKMDVDASAIPQGVEMTDDVIKQIRSSVQDKIDAVGSSTLKSMGVAFATKCDENAGVDVDGNQIAYLWKTGGKMFGFAAVLKCCGIFKCGNQQVLDSITYHTKHKRYTADPDGYSYDASNGTVCADHRYRWYHKGCQHEVRYGVGDRSCGYRHHDIYLYTCWYRNAKIQDHADSR